MSNSKILIIISRIIVTITIVLILYWYGWKLVLIFLLLGIARTLRDMSLKLMIIENVETEQEK